MSGPHFYPKTPVLPAHWTGAPAAELIARRTHALCAYLMAVSSARTPETILDAHAAYWTHCVYDYSKAAADTLASLAAAQEAVTTKSLAPLREA